MIKDTLMQEAYILNVLKISEYIKELRLPLLEICVQKLLKIDVNCTREQIVEAELANLSQLTESMESNPEAEVAATADMSTTNKSLVFMHFPLADRLDSMMEKLFLFIKSNCFLKDNSDNNNSNYLNKSDEQTQFDWELCKSIYKDLLYTFDKYIISTYGSAHVQFLMFYVCSFKSMLSEGFLDFLWKKFSSPASCQVTKQICAYYIGSFLARAKYIHVSTCVATCQLLVTWIHKYIEKQTNKDDKKTNSTSKNYYGNGLELHRTFYAVCQTLFYVIIFRHKQLFQEQSEIISGNVGTAQQQSTELVDLVKSWKLGEIVSSKLNPLRYCLPSVVKKFSRVAYINQIAYCYSIIDANNRVSLPTTSDLFNTKRMFFSNNNNLNSNKFLANNSNSNNNNNKIQGSTSTNENPLDSFFPFDPYLLKRSKCFIEKYHYFKYIFFIFNNQV
jgi:RNA polymerase I-specific transcription initiation factor RRN3